MTQTAQHSDPIARLALFGLLAIVCIAFIAPGVQASAPAQVVTTPQPIVVFQVATPTPALVAPVEVPAIIMQPTPTDRPAPVVIEQSPAVDQAPPPPAPVEALNDPAQNGGNIAPEGCAFPIVNDVCGGGNAAPAAVAVVNEGVHVARTLPDKPKHLGDIVIFPTGVPQP